jgi:hypothetical protein
MILTLFGVNYVDGLVATLESVLNEWEQNAVFFFVAVEERTNMTHLCELRTADMNRGCGLHSVVLAH